MGVLWSWGLRVGNSLLQLERAARETAQLAQMSSEQEDEVDEGAADELGGDGLSGRALGGPRFLDIQVLLTGDFRGSRVNLRTLQASNLSNLISFSGIVISASRTRWVLCVVRRVGVSLQRERGGPF